MPNDAPTPAGKAPSLTQRGLPDLLPRALSAFVLMAAALGSAWAGGLVFDLFWLCAALAVGFEWQRMIAAPYLGLRLLFAFIGLALASFFIGRGWFEGGIAALAAGGLSLAVIADPGRRLWASCGIAYAGLLPVSLGALYGSADYGVLSIFWLFAIVWGTDIFAYLGGRLIGGPKLWPIISPSKTWSGTLSGIIAGALLGTATAASCLGPEARAIPIFLLGLGAAAVSQIGDIFESWAKRRFGIKDSSNLIPGHGGFMDRLDGFIAAAAFAALFGAARGGVSTAAGLFAWA